MIKAGRSLLLLCVLLLIFAGCSDKNGQSATTRSASDQNRNSGSGTGEPAAKQSRARKFAELSGTDRGEAALVRVRLRPFRLYRDSAIEVDTEVWPRNLKNAVLVYRFWINDTMVQESASPILRPGRLEKGQGVFADVILRLGEEEVDRRRSDLVLVENSNPKIQQVIFPEIKGPGRHLIKVEAEDPDDDPLSFEIEGVDIPEWIQVDQSAGTIVLEPGEAPPEEVEFELIVRDNDNGEARRVITLRFRIPEETGTGANETQPET